MPQDGEDIIIFLLRRWQGRHRQPTGGTQRRRAGRRSDADFFDVGGAEEVLDPDVTVAAVAERLFQDAAAEAGVLSPLPVDIIPSTDVRRGSRNLAPGHQSFDGIARPQGLFQVRFARGIVAQMLVEHVAGHLLLLELGVWHIKRAGVAIIVGAVHLGTKWREPDDARSRHGRVDAHGPRQLIAGDGRPLEAQNIAVTQPVVYLGDALGQEASWQMIGEDGMEARLGMQMSPEPA